MCYILWFYFIIQQSPMDWESTCCEVWRGSIITWKNSHLQKTFSRSLFLHSITFSFNRSIDKKISQLLRWQVVNGTRSVLGLGLLRPPMPAHYKRVQNYTIIIYLRKETISELCILFPYFHGGLQNIGLIKIQFNWNLKLFYFFLFFYQPFQGKWHYI